MFWLPRNLNDQKVFVFVIYCKVVKGPDSFIHINFLSLTQVYDLMCAEDSYMLWVEQA